MLSNNMQLR